MLTTKNSKLWVPVYKNYTSIFAYYSPVSDKLFHDGIQKVCAFSFLTMLSLWWFLN